MSQYMQDGHMQTHFPPHIAFLTFAVHLESWFSACGLWPVCGINEHFRRDCLRPLENIDAYIMIYNSRKIIVMK